MILKFGKYAGWSIENVPDSYVSWMIDKAAKDHAMWSKELERRQAAEEAELPIIKQLVQAGYRELAKRYHPDTGGDTAKMQEVNAAYEWVRSRLNQVRS